ncbi:MAG TPA: ABC transporter permease [Spirochaetales bacterium]|nr:ABC transporter permease [Spirochaetales bacterium]
MKRARHGNCLIILLLLILFFFLVFNMSIWETALKTLFPQEKEVIYPRATLAVLVGEHLILVSVSTLMALFTGLLFGIFVTRPVGRDFLEIVNDITALAQTFPPVAVLALAVPLMGFGVKPTVGALFLFSILPILRNTISGLDSLAPEVLEAARGMGLSRLQILLKIELPLALPVIMAGIRIAVVINIGTATVGAVVGAGGLGAPIISGLVRNNPAFVLEGAATAAFLAVIADQLLSSIERVMVKTEY